jgi:hypothetical protein
MAVCSPHATYNRSGVTSPNATSNRDDNADTNRDTTSAIGGPFPVSDAIDATPYPCNPHGTIRRNQSKSGDTFSANP